MKIDLNSPETHETLWIAGDRIRIMGGLPGSGLQMVEVDIPPGSGTPPHSHASPEMFYIVEGELTIRQFGVGTPPEVKPAGPGMAVCIAPRMPHNYSNDGARNVKMIVLVETSMVDFFRDAGTESPEAQPDFARIGAAMERHQIDLLTMPA